MRFPNLPFPGGQNRLSKGDSENFGTCQNFSKARVLVTCITGTHTTAILPG